MAKKSTLTTAGGVTAPAVIRELVDKFAEHQEA